MTTNFQQLIASVTNRQVVQMTETGSTKFNVVGLGTKLGDLRGEKVPYVVMQDDVATVVMLHPRDAFKLFDNGSVKDYVFDDLIDEAVEVNGVSVVEVPVEKVKKVKEEKEVRVTTKDRAATIYREIYAAGQKRKDFIQRVIAELGMTQRGAETYHSNFHRVNHPWHIALH